MTSEVLGMKKIDRDLTPDEFYWVKDTIMMTCEIATHMSKFRTSGRMTHVIERGLEGLVQGCAEEIIKVCSIEDENRAKTQT